MKESLLFGIYGNDVLKYRDYFAKGIHGYELIQPDLLIVNNVTGRLGMPRKVSNNGKVLFLNGLAILRDHSLDELLSNPSAMLGSILKRDIHAIPEAFVNGAYNAVILTPDAIYIFNDFMALSPLYYSIQNRMLFFSTSLELLAEVLRAGWDPEAITEYMQLGYNFTYRTILKGIYCLLPASLLRYKNGQSTEDYYSTYPGPGTKTASHTEVVEEIHDKLKESIKRIYSPKVRYSLSLTGGMDSRILYLGWPSRFDLLTETAGEGGSDYYKARELTSRFGNVGLHELEDMRDDVYCDGIAKYYHICDNPTKLLNDFNYYHLLWKRNRGADIHLSGVGAELMNGESLYLNRNARYVLKEGIFPYTYHDLDDTDSSTLIRKVLYAGYKKDLPELLNNDLIRTQIGVEDTVAKKLSTFLGHPSFKEIYLERLRTLLFANHAYYPLSIISNGYDIPLFPYNDREFIHAVSVYHPATRELRRIEFAILRRYKLAQDIPLDTTHLKINHPYVVHKIFRVLRFVFNIGFHKRVPFIQKGEPPRFRAFKYFDHTMADYREMIRSCIIACPFYDKSKVTRYMENVDHVSRHTFFTHHREASNISTLFRLAIAERKFR